MMNGRLLMAAALACAATFCVGCSRPRLTRGPESPPPTEEPGATARAHFAEVAADYRRARAEGSLEGKACERLASRFATVADRYPSVREIALFDAAAVLHECGRSEAALLAYRKLLERTPSSRAHNNIGILLWQRGDRSEALAHFEAAVKLDPVGPEARNNLAAALRPRYVTSHDDETFLAAESALQSALAVRSDDPLAYENLARLYYDRGRHGDRSYLLLCELVIAQGESVAERTSSRSAELANLRGLVHAEQGDPVRAMRAFRTALQVDPDHPESHLNAGMIAIRFRDYAAARDDLEHALRSDRYRTDVDAHLGLGVARRGLRDYEGAAKAFERAHGVDESDPRALYNLAILYSDYVAPSKETFDRRSYERAIGYFERFERTAQGREFADRVADARLRRAKIRELIDITGAMERLEAQARERKQAERVEEEKRRRHLLELERRAVAAEAGTPES